MNTWPEFIVVLTTFPEVSRAREAARILVEARLAACCTFVEGSSVYRWKDNLSEDKEAVMLIKTRSSLYPELEKKLKQIHPYEVPEIIALPVVAASQNYSDWIKEATRD